MHDIFIMILLSILVPLSLVAYIGLMALFALILNKYCESKPIKTMDGFVCVCISVAFICIVIPVGFMISPGFMFLIALIGICGLIGIGALLGLTRIHGKIFRNNGPEFKSITEGVSFFFGVIIPSGMASLIPMAILTLW